jgi:hypothetical protein
MRGCVGDFEAKGPIVRHQVAICVTNFNRVGTYLREGSGVYLNLRRNNAKERAWNRVWDRVKCVLSILDCERVTVIIMEAR